MDLKFLASAGFEEPADPSDRLSDVAGVRVVELELGFNRVEEYEDASGASISYIETGTGLKAKSFALAGNTKSVSAHVWQLAPGLVCVRVVDLYGAIIKRVLANVTDPQLYPQFIVGMAAKPRRCLRYFLGAFAADVTVYPSVESWAKEHAPAGSAGAGVGVRALESRWLGPLLAGEVTQKELTSQATITGVVQAAEVARNELTGKPWYKVSVDCGLPVTLALPASTFPRPRPGTIVHGEVFMTGSAT
ncbi:hypothetical protein [Corynebacterium pyruviciproducens]